MPCCFSAGDPEEDVSFAEARSSAILKPQGQSSEFFQMTKTSESCSRSVCERLPTPDPFPKSSRCFGVSSKLGQQETWLLFSRILRRVKSTQLRRKLSRLCEHLRDGPLMNHSSQALVLCRPA